MYLAGAHGQSTKRADKRHERRDEDRTKLQRSAGTERTTHHPPFAGPALHVTGGWL